MLIKIKRRGRNGKVRGGTVTIDNEWKGVGSIQRVRFQPLGGRIGKWRESGASKHGQANKGSSPLRSIWVKRAKGGRHRS
jgi:hypothetical protein